MPHDTLPSVAQRTLFESPGLQIGHVSVRPRSSDCGDLEVSARNVLALPLAGVFAKHDGPRRLALATPCHALFITAGKPYRLSFPGCIGDECLVLRFTGDGLARWRPDLMSGAAFDEALLHPLAALPAPALLARSRLWQRFRHGPVDPLEAEEHSLAMLEAASTAARRDARPRPSSRAGTARSMQRLRRVARAADAISAHPGRRWTLDDLATLASVSPGHLALLFRTELGLSVYDYVIRSRLVRTLDPVLESDIGLTEIALEAGFASHSHFTARFRAFFGQTPQQLRRGLRGTKARELRRIATAAEAIAA